MWVKGKPLHKRRESSHRAKGGSKPCKICGVAIRKHGPNHCPACMLDEQCSYVYFTPRWIGE